MQIFKYIGLALLAAVVIISIYIHWNVKKKTEEDVEKVQKIVVKGSIIRTVLTIIAAVFLVLSGVG